MTDDKRTERAARVLASQHSARMGHFIPARDMPHNVVKAFWRRAQAVLRAADREEGPGAELYKAVPCPCGRRSCEDWHISPVAHVQGVRFTREQAEFIAKTLNEYDQMCEAQPERRTKA